MDQEQIKRLISEQRKFFDSGQTLDVGFRLGALHCLRKAVKRREAAICAAPREDPRRAVFLSCRPETAPSELCEKQPFSSDNIHICAKIGRKA